MCHAGNSHSLKQGCHQILEPTAYIYSQLECVGGKSILTHRNRSRVSVSRFRPPSLNTTNRHTLSLLEVSERLFQVLLKNTLFFYHSVCLFHRSI